MACRAVTAGIEASQVAKYGEYRDVAPLATGDHTVIDPLDELAMNHPHLTVIPVVAPDPSGDTS